MNTPWGKADYVKEVYMHTKWVCTPSHGGLMIAKGTANRVLSQACVKRGQVFGGYLAYEEDCQYALVAYEKPEWFENDRRDCIQVKESAWRTLSAYEPEYLIERGHELEMEGYKRYLKSQEHERMRNEKSADLIVSALNKDNGIIHVWTADGREHDIKAESYRHSECRLSKCVLVESLTAIN